MNSGYYWKGKLQSRSWMIGKRVGIISDPYFSDSPNLAQTEQVHSYWPGMFGNWILDNTQQSVNNFQYWTTYAIAYRYLPKQEWQETDTSDDLRDSDGDIVSVYTYH